MNWRVLIKLLIITIVFVGCSNNSSDENAKGELDDYPKKPIELMVPFSAGGGNDLVARTLANHASKYLPNNAKITVINKPGGVGVIGTTELFHSEPDGYNIGLFSNSVIAIQTHFDDTS